MHGGEGWIHARERASVWAGRRGDVPARRIGIRRVLWQQERLLGGGRMCRPGGVGVKGRGDRGEGGYGDGGGCRDCGRKDPGI